MGCKQIMTNLFQFNVYLGPTQVVIAITLSYIDKDLQRINPNSSMFIHTN